MAFSATNNKEHAPGVNFLVERINGNARQVVDALVHLEEKCVPLQMQNADAHTNYLSVLRQAGSFGYALRNKETYVGFVIVRRYSRSLETLVNHDPDLKAKPDSFLYIETIQIDPHFRGQGGMKQLLEAVIVHARTQNLKGLCLHARKRNGVSEFLQKHFHCKPLRSIENWLGCDEEFDYLELLLGKRTMEHSV